MQEYIEISVNNSEYKIIVDVESIDILAKYTWWIDTEGYAVTKKTVDGKRKAIKMHRLLAGFPDGVVDHINRNRLDNRISNLRITNRNGNAWNKKKLSISNNKYKGIGIEKRGKKLRYKARLAIYNKRISLGAYDSEEDAAKAYNVAAEFFQGEYALLNEVDHKGFVINISGRNVVFAKIYENEMYKSLYEAGLLTIKGKFKEEL